VVFGISKVCGNCKRVNVLFIGVGASKCEGVQTVSD